MTLDEIQLDIWTLTGEQSDLYNVTDGYDAELTRAVNNGLRTVATWRDPSTGIGLRYPKQTDTTLFQTYYTSGTLDDTGTTLTVVLPAADFIGTSDDDFNDWTIKVGGTTRRIMDYTASTLTCTLNEALGTAPTTEAYELSKDFIDLETSTTYNMVKPTGFVVPQMLYDMEESLEVERSSRTENFITLLTTFGNPTEYLFQDDKIRFNYTSEDSRWYRMEYVRMPAELSSGTDIPELPEMYHYAIALWGRWWGYMRAQGLQDAYAAKHDFIDTMRQLVGTYMFSNDRINTYGKIRR